MTDHLNIRFKFDSSQSRDPGRDPSSLEKMKVHLERLFQVKDVTVERLAFQANGKLVAEARLPFLTYDSDQSPATKLAYERFYLQSRTFSAEVRFELLAMEYKGQTYGAYELLHKHEEGISLRHMKLNQSAGEMYIRHWLSGLMAGGLSDSELLDRAQTARDHLQPIVGDDWNMPLLGGKQPVFEKALSTVARPVLTHARSRELPIRAATLVGELQTFVKFFTAYRHPQFAAPEITLEASVQDLTSRYDMDEGTTMSPSFLGNVLGQVAASSDNGQWLRYGMFLASQLALEIIDGKGGTQNIADLRAQLAESFGATVEPRGQEFKI
jgi:hypothetical protein